MKKNFHPQIQFPGNLSTPALWFVFNGEEILLQQDDSKALHIPTTINIRDFKIPISGEHYLGIYGNIHCFVAEAEKTSALPECMAYKSLRQAYDILANEDLFLIASRAKQILLWDKSTQFCGYCGSKTQLSENRHERAKLCLNCNNLFYPHIAPVILVRIQRQNQLLLARSPNFLPGVYSVLAGFIEPGESAEQAVIREVVEEVGVQIKNINYFGSQPWPFPSNLMLAFTAEHAGGEIIIDNREIEDARWFSVDNLPALPKKMSLSRKLIDAFVEGYLRY
jgi:NAD+ diphosphatase